MKAADEEEAVSGGSRDHGFSARENGLTRDEIVQAEDTESRNERRAQGEPGGSSQGRPAHPRPGKLARLARDDHREQPGNRGGGRDQIERVRVQGQAPGIPAPDVPREHEGEERRRPGQPEQAPPGKQEEQGCADQREDGEGRAEGGPEALEVPLPGERVDGRADEGGVEELPGTEGVADHVHHAGVLGHRAPTVVGRGYGVDRLERIAVREPVAHQERGDESQEHEAGQARPAKARRPRSCPRKERDGEQERDHEGEGRDPGEGRSRSRHAEEEGVASRPRIVLLERGQGREHGEECKRVVAPALDAPVNHHLVEGEARGGQEPDQGGDGGRPQGIKGEHDQGRERRGRDADPAIVTAAHDEAGLRGGHEHRLAEAGLVEVLHVAGVPEVGQGIAGVGPPMGRRPAHRRGVQLKERGHELRRPGRALVWPVPLEERLHAQRGTIEKDEGRQDDRDEALEPRSGPGVGPPPGHQKGQGQERRRRGEEGQEPGGEGAGAKPGLGQSARGLGDELVVREGAGLSPGIGDKDAELVGGPLKHEGEGVRPRREVEDGPCALAACLHLAREDDLTIEGDFRRTVGRHRETVAARPRDPPDPRPAGHEGSGRRTP